VSGREVEQKNHGVNWFRDLPQQGETIRSLHQKKQAVLGKRGEGAVRRKEPSKGPVRNKKTTQKNTANANVKRWGRGRQKGEAEKGASGGTLKKPQEKLKEKGNHLKIAQKKTRDVGACGNPSASVKNGPGGNERREKRWKQTRLILL